ncbi:glycosyltransferase family 2 protein [filamentous cyanobacterium CCP5]|nr:glycosyltransferase family 2 protein [filamentous cyanobacterium CCP5]
MASELMMENQPHHALSAIIIAQDEADCIAQAVRSCQHFADEILVVDGGSQDDTPAIAAELGAVVHHNPWPGYAKQRNYGADQAAHDWVFFLDADEWVDDQLAAALNDWKRQPTLPAQAFSISRIGDFLGVWLAQRPESHIRLYDKTRFRIKDVLVHETPDVGDAPVVKLPGTVLHAGFRTVGELAERFNMYTDLDAQKAYGEGQRFNLLRFLLKPPAKFLQMYLRNGMFRAGKAGLFLASLWSYYIVLKELKLYEIDWAAKQPN